MGLHANKVSRHAYNRFRVRNLTQLYSFTDRSLLQDRIRTKMKEKGEGLWIIWENVPKSYQDWLVKAVSTSSLFLRIGFLNEQVMNDGAIPFMREYGEWAILTAAKRSAAGWRKRRYQDHTLEVPVNKRYLAKNSAKRNPNSPRGARFPARPSRHDWTVTPDDDGSTDDERIPVLPPGPSTMGNSAGFPNGTVTWTPEPPFNHPIQPIPGPSQLPYSIVPWGPSNPQSLPSSSTSTNLTYWENSPPCACIDAALIHSTYN